MKNYIYWKIIIEDVDHYIESSIDQVGDTSQEIKTSLKGSNNLRNILK